MKISIDDWHFRPELSGILAVDVYLDNGQHALLEVNPMRNLHAVNGEIPEIIAFCELPGEKLVEGTCPARWISRPPDRGCAWSNVQIPMALMEQIKVRLAAPDTAAPDTPHAVHLSQGFGSA